MEENIAVLPQIPVQAPSEPVTKPKNKFLNKKWLVLGLVLLILIVLGSVGSYFYLNANKQVACTLEAKLCPDGSSVGRTGPKCEFAKCPSVTTTPEVMPLPTLTASETASWKTYNVLAEKISFRLPNSWAQYNNSQEGIGSLQNPYDYYSSKPNKQLNQENFSFYYERLNFSYADVVNHYMESNAKDYPINEKLIIDGKECLFTTSSKPTVQGGYLGPIDTYSYDVECASYNNMAYTFSFFSRNHQNELLFKEILSTLKFTD